MVRLLRLVLPALLSIWMLVYTVELGKRIVDSYIRLPMYDYWEIVPHLDGYRQFPPAILWQQHYEHRIVFPEAVFAMDWLFFKGREVLPLLLGALLDLAVWGIFGLAFSRRPQGLDPPSWCALFLCGIVMFWPGMAVVLATPFLLQFVLFQFVVIVSLLALARRRVFLAIAFAIAATFTSANGLFLWPILAAMALVLEFKQREAVTIVVASAISTAIFFHGYHNLGNFNLPSMWKHPAKFLGYFLSYLGMPLGAGRTAIALGVGAGSILLFVSACYLAWRNRLLKEPFFLVPAGVVAITFATGLATSFSRVPMDWPFVRAVETPGRYINFGAHYWAALIVLTIAVLSAMGRRAQWGAAATFTVLLATTLAQGGPWIHDWMNQYALGQSATLALESGLSKDQAAQTLNFTDVGLVKRSLVELERRHLAMYSWDDYKQLGKPFRKADATKAAPSAQITSVIAVPGGFEIVGWLRERPRRLFLVDRAGTVIGFGAHDGAGLPIGVPAPRGHEPDFFLAYAGTAFNQSQVRLFVID